MPGADYSMGRPGGQALAAAGVTFVMRYAARGRDNVNVHRDEVDDLLSHGIAVGVVNEHEAAYLLGGHSRGADAAAGARDVAVAAGLSGNLPIYFACDFDATLGGPPVSAAAIDNMRRLLDTLQGAATALGGWQYVGLYGSVFVQDWIYVNTPLSRFWQCAAWSRGVVSPRAAIYQRAQQITVNGVSCDVNDLQLPALAGLYGLTSPPAPVSTETARAVQRAVRAAPDGIWGPDTDRRCEAVRAMRNVPTRASRDLVRYLQGAVLVVRTDGIWGPVTSLAWISVVRRVQGALGVPADGIWGPQTDVAYQKASPLR